MQSIMKIMSITSVAILFYYVCEYVHVDWQLMLCAIRDSVIDHVVHWDFKAMWV